MVIDFHTHFYPEKIAAKALDNALAAHIQAHTDGTRAGLLASMARAGIDRAVGLPLVTAPEYARGLLRWAKNHDEAPVTMLGSIHPRDPEVLRHIELAAELGFPGLKVHPEYQQFAFEEPELAAVWRKIAETGMFLITHAGCDSGFPPPYHTDPKRLAAFHRNFPELKLVLAHGGSHGMWREVMQFLVTEEVWFDLAFVSELLPPEGVRKLIRAHGAERCLFGTDSPWCDQAQALANIRALHLGKLEEEMILAGNAEALLNKKSV